MDADSLRKAAIELHGERGWISALARDLKVDRSTVHRWLQGASIPGVVEVAIGLMLERHRASPKT